MRHHIVLLHYLSTQSLALFSPTLVRAHVVQEVDFRQRLQLASEPVESSAEVAHQTKNALLVAFHQRMLPLLLHSTLEHFGSSPSDAQLGDDGAARSVEEDCRGERERCPPTLALQTA